MKTLKSLMLFVALLVVGTVANAKPKPAVLTKNDVLNLYINAVVHGKIDGLNDVLDEDVAYTVPRGNNVTTLNKKRIMAALQASENVEQGCTYTTTTVEDKSDNMVVKLDLKYDGYVRSSLITISLARPDWKITKIENLIPQTF